jgi:glutamate synthase domain-containing protein 1
MKRAQRYIPSGCATAGILHERGELIGGEVIMQSIAAMHERSNGLGGSFVGYGIYPEMKDFYALHLMYDHDRDRPAVEELLERKMSLVRSERIPTRPTPGVGLAPVLWRYFVQVPPAGPRLIDESEDDYLGREVSIQAMTEEDWGHLRRCLTPFCEEFDFDLGQVLDWEFTKLLLISTRPYGRLYAGSVGVPT